MQNKRLEELYQYYLNTWAKYFNDLNIKDTPTLLSLITEVMYKGIFSINPYKYHDYIIDLFDMFSKRGYRVISGNAVCRHNAKFFVDLLQKMGYQTTYLGGCILYGKSSGHAILGVENKEESFIFDPTSNDFLNFLDMSELSNEKYYKLCNFFLKLIYKSNLESGLLVYSSNTSNAFITGEVKKHKELLERIKNSEEIETDYVCEVQNKAHQIFRREYYSLLTVREPLLKDMVQIEKLERKLAPHWL